MLTQHTGIHDVIVVGGGNAGFCAAHAAADAGASVLLLERAPEHEAGGNSYYTAGAFRVVHGGAGEPAALCRDDTTTERLADTDLAAYTAEEFHADMQRITDGRCDAAMTDWLVEDSADLPAWLADRGIRWRLMYERQSYQVDGRWVFSGGLALGTVAGGKGLVEQHTSHARSRGVEIRYDSHVTRLLTVDGRVTGVEVASPEGGTTRLEAGAVVVTAGGFEADPELRARHLGAQWRHALVRGNPLNTGDLLGAALDIGRRDRAVTSASCHSVAWDAGAPAGGGERRADQPAHPAGLPDRHLREPGRAAVPRRGRRLPQLHLRQCTGGEILEQPGGVAFQLFDATTRPMLRARGVRQRADHDGERR